MTEATRAERVTDEGISSEHCVTGRVLDLGSCGEGNAHGVRRPLPRSALWFTSTQDSFLQRGDAAE